ncbi:hypothetical protein [Streptomyces virginiae]|uniref:hypothetical protein n=1 Tax=Streptomyces virginiae TaxID=1961 RepID=UPI003660C8FF
MPASALSRRAYRSGTTRRRAEQSVSAQLDHTPRTPYASAVDAFAASGYDDSGTIDMTELWRRR